MNPITRLIPLVWALLLGVWTSICCQAQSPYNITVQAGELRQTFAGFGVSQPDQDWTFMPSPAREQAVDLVYGGLGTKIFRMWISSDDTQTVTSMLNEFNSRFVASGAISTFMAKGVDTLLLAPCRSKPLQHWSPDLPPPTEPMSAYAARLAEVIAQIELTYGVQIHATGIANEPASWSTQQLTDCINFLRAELDARGLQNVKIVAPESSNGSYPFVNLLDAFYHNGAAWANLSGIAHHSYSNVLYDERQWDRKRDKEWWMTECSDLGVEPAEDENRASTVLARFLCDLNTGVDRWIYFRGVGRTANLATYTGAPAYLALYDQATSSLVTYLRYYYLKQALGTIEPGAIIRRCTSATEGGMNYVVIQNPAINAAAAVNTDGSWGVNIVNATGVVGSPAKANNLFYPAANYNVTVTIEELASTPSKTFTVWRSKAGTHYVNSGTVNFVNGVGTVTVNSRELVSLRSAAATPAIPPAPTGLAARSESNASATLTWKNTVGANTWNIKRATASGGPYSVIATSASTRYTDVTAVPGTTYYYVVSALNVLGESANSAQVATPAAYGFVNQDIGSTTLAGSLSIPTPGTYSITGTGIGLGSVSDGFNYTYARMSGDGSIIARLASAPLVSGATVRVGLMMREQLGAQSGTAAVFFQPSAGGKAWWYYRTDNLASGNYVEGPVITAPRWFKLTRSGATITGYVSADGTTWTQLGTANYRMFGDIHVGMFVSSSNATTYGSGVFDNVSLPPQIPVGLKASASGGTISLDWRPVFGATGYKVKRATSPGGPYTVLGTPSVASYTDATATGSTPYFYVVSATSGAGESLNSPEVRGDTVAFWDFSRSGGERAADQRLGGIALKPLDAGVSMNWIQEGVGGALHFGGTLRLTPAFTAPTISLPEGKVSLETWIKADPSQLGSRSLGILQYGDYASNGFRLVIEQDRKVSWLVQNGSSEIRLQSSTLISGGLWTHIAATYDGANMKIYIDGVLVGTRALSGGIVQPANNNQLRIGQISSGSNTYFQGDIRSVRISSRPQLFF